MKTTCQIIFSLVLLCTTARSQDFLDQIDEALSITDPGCSLRADLSILADVEYYAGERQLPGLLFGDQSSFLNPRLAVFLDLQAGDYFQARAQMRVDRGFDPNVNPDGEARLDEYFIRLRPLGDDRLNIQAGRFASVIGNWIPRHLSWDNPFVTAPSPYEDVLAITDQAAPPSPAAFLNRQNLPDNKRGWVPLIWGPVYASGAAVFGKADWLDYAVEVKSAALSSRPAAWEDAAGEFDHLTVGSRLGVRPSPEWAVGASFSHGPYLMEAAEGTLPKGSGIDDFDQTTWGLDASWQHHHWQVWGEIFYSSFDVPNVGEAEAVSYYLETKYKLAADWWLAARWNQSFLGDVPDGKGGEAQWDRDAWRADFAIGHRFSRHVQAKVQYSYGDKQGRDQEGDHLLAAQVTVRF